MKAMEVKHLMIKWYDKIRVQGWQYTPVISNK